MIIRKPKHLSIIAFMIFIASGCNTVKHGGLSEIETGTEVHLGSVDNNVCKKLRGRVVLYVIFVDTKGTKPWSEFDINSTLDSINKAMNWISKQSVNYVDLLNIEVQFPQNNRKIPIAFDLPKKTLNATLFQPSFSAGLKAINSWSDRIAVTAARSLPPDTSRIITTRNSLSDKERLIARLRDIYKTDNIALMYFINNYYSAELSVTFNTFSQTNVEYSITSFKSPSVIAHEFLHLFGAWDLYITPFDNDKDVKKRKSFVMKEFPNEIMAFAYRGIDSLEISPFTKYCIGWSKQLDQKYTEMILGKDIRPVKY